MVGPLAYGRPIRIWAATSNGPEQPQLPDLPRRHACQVLVRLRFRNLPGVAVDFGRGVVVHAGKEACRCHLLLVLQEHAEGMQVAAVLLAAAGFGQASCFPDGTDAPRVIVPESLMF